MKKIIALLALAMMISMTACGNTNDPANTEAPATNAPVESNESGEAGANEPDATEAPADEPEADESAEESVEA